MEARRRRAAAATLLRADPPMDRSAAVRRAASSALLACLALAAPALGAQERGDARLRVAGRVVEAVARTPVAGAVVQVPGLGIRVRTDADGSFQLPRVPAGTHRFEVSRIGYVTNKQSIGLAPGDSLVIIPVLAKAVVLEGLSVSADRLARRRERVATAVHAVSRAEIEASASLDARDLVLTRLDLKAMDCGRARPGGCGYRARGQVYSRIQVYVDDQPAVGGLSELETYTTPEVYLVEWYPGASDTIRGPMLRIYTVWYVEQLARRGGRLPKIVF